MSAKNRKRQLLQINVYGSETCVNASHICKGPLSPANGSSFKTISFRAIVIVCLVLPRLSVLIHRNIHTILSQYANRSLSRPDVRVGKSQA